MPEERTSTDHQRVYTAIVETDDRVRFLEWLKKRSSRGASAYFIVFSYGYENEDRSRIHEVMSLSDVSSGGTRVFEKRLFEKDDDGFLSIACAEPIDRGEFYEFITGEHVIHTGMRSRLASKRGESTITLDMENGISAVEFRGMDIDEITAFFDVAPHVNPLSNLYEASVESVFMSLGVNGSIPDIEGSNGHLSDLRKDAEIEREWIKLMGLFGNRKKRTAEEIADEVEAKAIESGKPLRQAMIDAVGVGSKDAKVVIVSLNDKRKLNFWVSNGVIKHVSDGTENAVLSRLQWTADGISPEQIERVKSIVSEGSFFTSMKNIVEELPENVSAQVADAYANKDTEIVVSTRESIVDTTEIDWMIEDDDSLISQYSSFSLPVSEIDEFIERYLEDERKAADYLNGADESSIAIGKTDSTDYFKASSDEERFVIVAALNGTTLKEIHEASAGFNWNSVLRAVESLMWKKLINVDFPEEEEDFPEFDISPDEFDKFMNKDEAGGDFEKQDDDGGFEFSEEGISSAAFFTEHLHDDLRTPVETVLQETDVPEMERNDIRVLLSYITEFEKDTDDVERAIRESKREHDRDFGKFEEMALTKGLDDDADDKDDEVLEDLRSSSNDQWFVLESDEKRRDELNSRRADALRELRTHFISLDGDHVQEVIAVIDAKLEGIDNVENVTIHSEDEISLGVSPTVDGEEWTRYLDDRYSPSSTPLFYELIEQFGFNPFDLARKSDSIIVEDGAGEISEPAR